MSIYIYTYKKKISVRISKLNLICQTINEKFYIKAKCRHVSIIANITKQKHDFYTIINTIASKNLVYLSIFTIINSFILVLLLIIIFIED